MRNFLFLLLVVGLAAFSLTGCDRAMRKPMMDVVTPTNMPTMDDPEAFTVAFVQTAIDLYKMEGREAAVAYYNKPESVSGQWYVFIVDDNDLILSHATLPVLVGSDIKDIIGVDSSGLGVKIAKATEEGHWVDYVSHNSTVNKLQLKRTWSIRYDGYIFGSGYYQAWRPDPATLLLGPKSEPETFTRNFVLAAIARYEFDGREAAVAYYNDPANIDGQWYVAISDQNDIYLAHPTRPDLIGKDRKETLGIDGSRVGAEIVKTTGPGHWTEYLWLNPESGEIEQKRTWAIRHDGHVFAAGYYRPIAEDASSEAN